MSITTLSTFQSLLNGIIVRSEADFPDRVVGDITSITGSVGQPANFNFDFNPTSPATPYIVGNTFKVTGSTSGTYDTGEAIIKTVGVGTLTATTPAGADILITTPQAGAGGNTTRLLAKDTEWIITVNIATTLGYELVDETRLSITVVLGPENRITINGAVTFLTGRLVRGLAFQNIIVQTATPGAIYMDIEGGNDPTVSIITWRDTSVQGFTSLGRVDGASFAAADSIFPAYNTGFTITNSIVNVANVGYLPLASSTSSFLDINNVQQGLISPISQTQLPFTVTMTNLTALNKVNQFGVNINPATPLTNTFAITNTTKPIGGEMFSPSSTALTGAVARFESPVNSTITDVNDNSGLASLDTPSTAGIAIGDTIFVTDNTGIFTGPAQVTAFSANLNITINKTFVAATITGRWDKVGELTTTVVTTANHNLVDTNDVEFKNSVNYNQQFDITSIPSATTLVIPQIFRTPDPGIATFTQIRKISNFESVATVTETITTITDNGRGGSTVTLSGTLASSFRENRRVILSGTTDGGTGATATAVLTNEVVTSIPVTAAGASYGTPPIVRITIAPGGTRATAVAVVNMAGAVTQIIITSGGSGYGTTEPTVTLISTDGDFDGEFKIFKVTTTTFDIFKKHGGSSSVGQVDLDLTKVTSVNHKFVTGNAALIDKTIEFDEGYVLETVSPTADAVTIDKLFISKSSPITGTISDASLTGTALNVLVNTVSGEVNSKAKGSFSMNNNSTTTDMTGTNVYVDNIILSGTPLNVPVTESDDTELFRLINSTNGILKYTGLEPFSGQLLVTIVYTTGNNKKITFRAVKNEGVMANAVEKSITGPNAETNVTFLVSITAITNDEFKLQAKNETDATDVTFTSVTAVIQ